MAPGITMLRPSGRQGMHLYVIVHQGVYSGYGNSIQYVSVNFTSVKDGIPYDTACIIDPGEHPFITQRSYVNYRQPLIDSDAHLRSLISKGQCIPHEHCCSATLLRKIQLGLCASDRTPREFRNIMGCQ